MSWLRQSDTLWRDVEFTKLSDGAQALWHRANSWIADQLTDGHIPESTIKLLATRARYVRELEQAGYWVGQPSGGWLAAGWQEFIQSRASVVAKRTERNQRRSSALSRQAGSFAAPPSPSPSPNSLLKPIVETKTNTSAETAAGGVGGSDAPAWIGKTPESDFDASIVGYKWFELLRGGVVPPLDTCRRDYGWIGSRPAPERLQVAQSIAQTQWCADNRGQVTTGHVVRFWAAYLEGPRNGRKVASSTPLEAARARMKEAEKAYREAERYNEPTEKLYEVWDAASKEFFELERRAS